MSRLHACWSFALLLVVVTAPSPAGATPPTPPPWTFCGVFSTDGYFVIGEDRDNPGTAAMCNWNPVSGVVTYYNFGGCDTSTPVGEYIKITAGGSYTGSTVLAPVVESEILCVTSSGNHKILKWNSSFKFGFWFTGYKSIARVWGTPNADQIYTSVYGDYPVYYNNKPGKVCGYEGDDYIMGDYSSGIGDEECLNGGVDDDICYGGGPSTDTWSEDTAYRCETVDSVRSIDVEACECGESPPAIWTELCDDLPFGC